MKTFNHFKKKYLELDEELNPRQKNVVDTWNVTDHPGEASPKAKQLSSHVIPEGHDHVVIPAIPTVLNKIKHHLEQNGYTLHDYAKGLAKDQYGRELNIGKVLNKTKAPRELINSFASDDRSSAGDLHNHDIVISRNPYHIAEASTNKEWKSCATLTPSGKPCKHGDGIAAKHLPNEIREGTHVAYLVPKEPLNSSVSVQDRINKAKARVFLKPFYGLHNHTVLVPETKVYSKKIGEGKNQGFLDTLQDFTHEHFPMNSGDLYRKKESVYDDDKHRTSFNMSPDSLNKIFNNLTQEKIIPLLNNDKLHPDFFDKIFNHVNNEYKETGGEFDYVAHHNMDKLLSHSGLKSHHIDTLLDSTALTPGFHGTLANRSDLSSDHMSKILPNITANKQGIISMLNRNAEKILPEHINTLDSKVHAPDKVDILNDVIRHNKLSSDVMDSVLSKPRSIPLLNTIYNTHKSRLNSDQLHSMIKTITHRINNDNTYNQHEHESGMDLLNRIIDSAKLTPPHIHHIVKNIDDRSTHFNLLNKHGSNFDDNNLHDLINKYMRTPPHPLDIAGMAQNELISRQKNQQTFNF